MITDSVIENGAYDCENKKMQNKTYLVQILQVQGSALTTRPRPNAPLLPQDRNNHPVNALKEKK